MNAKVVALISLVTLLLLIGWPTDGAAGGMAVGADLVLAGADFAQGDLKGLQSGPDGLTLEESAVSGRFLSPVLQAPLPFSAVIPQWLEQVPPMTALDLQIRTRTRNGAWGEWAVIVENDDWMLPGEADKVGQLIPVPAAAGAHREFQLAAGLSRYDSSGPAPHLARLTLTFIDARGPSAAELAARQAELDAQHRPDGGDGYPKPPVISREVWCIDPACNYSDGLEYEPVTHLIVHHTVSNNANTDWAAVVRAVWYFHTFTRGWGDIGYNYLVDIDGLLYEGHLGGDDVVGTHASGANTGSMALALLGTFTDPDEDPPGIPPGAAMLDSAAELFAWKADQKDIDVYDAGPMPNMDWGLPHLMGHRDVYGTTSCPGNQAHELLPWLRDEVAERTGFISPNLYIDELSSAFSAGGPPLNTASAGCGFAGHAYYAWSTTDPAESDQWAVWQIEPSAPGRYQLEVYAPYCLTGAPETAGARYHITHAGGSETVTASHEDNVGLWMSLGRFEFVPGANGQLRLTDLTTTDDDLGVWFDAVRLRLVPPEAVTEEPAAGQWLNDPAISFSWSISGTTSFSSTLLQVADTISFTNLLISQTITDSIGTTQHTFGQDYDRLYWRVALSTTNQVITSPISYFGLDTVPPTSTIDTIYGLDDGSYLVGWQGSDGLSGVSGYNIDVRAAGTTTWTRLLTATTELSFIFDPPDEQVYWLRSQAIDLAGNVQAANTEGQMSTDQAVSLARAIMIPMVFRP